MGEGSAERSITRGEKTVQFASSSLSVPPSSPYDTVQALVSVTDTAASTSSSSASSSSIHRRGGRGGSGETAAVHHRMAVDDDGIDGGGGEDTIRLDECFSGADGVTGGDSGSSSTGGDSGGGGNGDIASSLEVNANPPIEPYPPLSHKRARTGITITTKPLTHWLFPDHSLTLPPTLPTHPPNSL